MGVPTTVAWLLNKPASISACVIIYCAENDVLSEVPSAKVIGPPNTLTPKSLTITLDKSLLPILVTVNV